MMSSLTIVVVTILIAGTCDLLGQVPVDLSRAKRFKTVWKVVLTGHGGSVKYLPKPCDVEGMDILSFATTKAGRSYYTQPRIDTNGPTTNWGSSYIRFDYDGIPPLEYMNDAGRVERCTEPGAELMRDRIDTIRCWANAILPGGYGDVDGDGYDDIVCDIGGGALTARIIRGGPHAGKGCERFFEIPYPAGTEVNTSVTREFYRSVTRKWRTVRRERRPDYSSDYLVLYEVNVRWEADSLKMSFVELDKFKGGGRTAEDVPFGNSMMVVDTVSGHDWFLIHRAVSYNPTVYAVERFDLTSGKFVSSGEQVTGLELYLGDERRNLGRALDARHHIVGIQSRSGIAFCDIEDLVHPLYLWVPTNTGTQPVSGYAVVNDQTGDGIPDLIVGGGGPDATLLLTSIDENVTSAEETGSSTVPSLTMEGDMILVERHPDRNRHFDVMTLDGRLVVSGHIISPGNDRYRCDIRQLLSASAPGPYLIIVDGSRATAVMYRKEGE